MTTATLTKQQAETILCYAIHASHKDFDYLLEGIQDNIRSGAAEVLGTEDCDDAVDELMDCVIAELSYKL